VKKLSVQRRASRSVETLKKRDHSGNHGQEVDGESNQTRSEKKRSK